MELPGQGMGVQGLTSKSSKTTRPPQVTGPKLLPKKKTVARQVFLEPERWTELADAASFHTQVFEEMGADERVSRNDLIDSFLGWALAEYWKDKGGRPTSERDRAEKVKRHAEALTKTSSK